jgi:mannose-1-phosphate guanylyltransferase
MPISEPRQIWTVILAGGEGTRLRRLTRALHNEDRPKQFAFIHAGRSLLQSTLARCERWSAPERSVVVVSREREALARSQLAEGSSVDLVAQPSNCGTGPGVLLPLARVLARDPEALVVILPSDHYVRDEAAFERSIAHALETARAQDTIVLIGAVPDSAETQYGWIAGHGPGGCGHRLLQRAQGLCAVPLEACGWSDWGTPERVLESLRHDLASRVLRRRLEAAERRALLESLPAAALLC